MLCVITALGLAPDISSLARRASVLSTGTEPLTNFMFDSQYSKGGHARAWANWLFDGLMLGQYPHTQPAQPGPDADDTKAHLTRSLSAGIDCFVCLQAELPPQQDDSSWPEEGMLLPDAESRARWPAPFMRYAPDADAIHGAPLKYLHCPIADLDVPRDGLGAGASLLMLLDSILRHYEDGGTGVYLHCWGGRGRAGLVGACLLALFRPELSADGVLEIVQTAYDSRVGASSMPGALKRSPQTDEQRQFVRKFVARVASDGERTCSDRRDACVMNLER